MTANQRRVAVIGAGPAGAIATDALVKEHTFGTIRVFERQSIAGGTWLVAHGQIFYDGFLFLTVISPRVFQRKESHEIPNLRSLLEKGSDLNVKAPLNFPFKTSKREDVSSHRLRYSDTAAHEHLHSNLPPSIMAFSQEPIPEVLSEQTRLAFGPTSPFRHRELIRDWVEAILDRGGHKHLVEYNTTVELAEKQGDEWVLTLRKEGPDDSDDYWWQERFDSLVVATGHYYVPFVPNIPGLAEYVEEYPERITHSKYYQDKSRFTDKVSPNWFYDLDEFIHNISALTVFRKWQRVIVVGGSVSAFDAVHDIRRVSKLPLISSLRKASPIFGPAAFAHPNVVNRPHISAFDANTGRITFADGTSVDDVDVVLFATGYEFSFPFLPGVKPVNGRIPGLYQHVFSTCDPTLAFLGMVRNYSHDRIYRLCHDPSNVC